jgi:hypothetical protein
LEQGKALAFKYRARAAKKSRAVTLDDALLELRGSYWYVTGHDRQRRADRSFRLNRIQGNVRAVPAGAGKRAQAAWSHWHVAVGEPVEAELHRGCDAAPLPEGLLVLGETPEGVRVRTSNALALMRWLCTGVGWDAVGPQAFVDALGQRLDRLAP